MSDPSSVREIRETLALLVAADSVAELRIPGTRQGVVSGYFTDLDAMARAAAKWSGRAEGVYMTLNPVDPRLLARSANRLTPFAKHTTSDRDIITRRWILFDFDPVRPAGVSATDEENHTALIRAQKARRWLSKLGWPKVALADSGNGAHLLARVDLPNDTAAHTLIHRVLEAAAVRFTDETVTVDLSTSNAARLVKVYGTDACKGDSTKDRPHRRSLLLDVPADS